MYEPIVVALNQAERLGVELERRAFLVDRGDAREKFGVEVDEVLVGGEFRSLDGLDILEGGVGVCAGDSPKAAMARSSNRPLFSMATMVLSRVGALGLFAMVWISACCCAMPDSIAGW